MYISSPIGCARTKLGALNLGEPDPICRQHSGGSRASEGAPCGCASWELN